MSQENKALVRRIVDEVQSAYKIEVMDQIFSPRFVNHTTVRVFNYSAK